ncbi:MAG: M1 family metallopeptidase [Saprospiraceae bacterium]
MNKIKYLLCLMLLSTFATAQNTNTNKFRQLGQELPTPNIYRAASGAPGHQYWQQKVDYEINLELNDETQRIDGDETITYTNNSPDVLTYLWLQLDQNMRAKDSDTYKIRQSDIDKKMSSRQIESLVGSKFDGGFKIESVKDANGKPLPYTINKTMMRVDLPQALKPGEKYSFKVEWWYNINDRMKMGGRSGYEYFEEDDNYLYTIAQFYPRMVMYNDIYGWQHKQFLGRGEFTLCFGDYKVNITVPADHVVASTGTLQNADEILTEAQQKLFEESKTAKEPVIIVSQKEAEKKEKKRAKDKKTWTYYAENVRDFGFASSRKFIWDAMGVQFGDRTVMAMSYYPKEGNPLWEQYSTKAVAHTLDVYSRYTFDYPYPVAISVHAKSIGMEYPMICFNFGRPEKDGTYNERTKYGMIGVIIHEVGHNYFPMIVNSDERQWTWMDEGLNSFLQYLTEQEWERGYPSRRGPAWKIVPYMSGDKSNISPIMTNSESIFQFGNNAYGKPATALNILRETVMGRELFDHAFKEYSQRWMFKHPSPADFFRTMEDASGMDLDWFWRGWFYTTDNVDIAIKDVKWYNLKGNPDEESKIAKKQRAEKQYITEIRNKTEVKETVTERDPSTNDFYNSYDPLNVLNLDRKEYEKYYNSLDNESKAMLQKGYNFYEIKFENIGGLVMPLIVEFEYTDGTKEVRRIPAEIWKMLPHQEVTKVFVTEKEVKQITLDPYLETADTDTGNNYFPARQSLNRFEMYQQKKGYSRYGNQGENPMQRAARDKKN